MKNNFKMPVILIGNSFKYEIEATLKMFFPVTAFAFSDSLSNADGGNYIVAGAEESRIYAEIMLDGERLFSEKNLSDMSVKNAEHELCRLIFHLLGDRMKIAPPWGLMTGIRPVKKVTELMEQGRSYGEIRKILTERFEISEEKFRLAYDTAVNQFPILKSLAPESVSLYISIPFCPTRCSYCSFVSHSMDTAIKLIPEYVDALCRELEITGEIVRETGVKINTVYFGGGTPTSLSAEEIRTIMECVRKNFDLENVLEYSFEAGRPDTVTAEKLRVIKEMGADRISINTQTLNDEVLKNIGRNHTADEFFRAFELARNAGFGVINTDLIAGLPTETTESFIKSLDGVIALSPENITVHTLTIKRASNLFEQERGENDISVSDMVDYSIDALTANGYMPYYLYRQKNTVDNLENVGYSKKNCESRYNIFIMDETQTIIGAGCSASTKLVYPDGKISRIHNYKFPYEYIRRFEQLMNKKKEITECLKKISSQTLR